MKRLIIPVLIILGLWIKLDRANKEIYNLNNEIYTLNTTIKQVMGGR